MKDVTRRPKLKEQVITSKGLKVLVSFLFHRCTDSRFVLAEKLPVDGISNTRIRTKRRTTLKSDGKGANVPRERFPKVTGVKHTSFFH